MSRVVGKDIAIVDRIDVPGRFECGVEQHAQAVPAADLVNAPQRAGVKKRFDLQILRVHPHLPGHGEGHGCRIDRRCDAIGIFQRQIHRLLQYHSLAGRRLPDQFGVQRGLRCHQHHLHIAREQFLRRGIRFNPVLLHRPVEPRVVAVPTRGRLNGQFAPLAPLCAVGVNMGVGKAQNPDFHDLSSVALRG